MYQNLEEKKLTSTLIFDGKVVHLYKDTVELPNGEPAVREVVRHTGAVAVIPITDNDEVIFVKQFRYPFATVLTEIPAGKLDSDSEEFVSAALRELKEETGCIVETIGDEFVTINEYSFETLYIGHYFLCKVVSEGEYHLTPTEIDHGMQPVWIDLDEAVAIFETYPQKREDHRSLYLRELTVLRKYLAEKAKP